MKYTIHEWSEPNRPAKEAGAAVILASVDSLAVKELEEAHLDIALLGSSSGAWMHDMGPGGASYPIYMPSCLELRVSSPFFRFRKSI